MGELRRREFDLDIRESYFFRAPKRAPWVRPAPFWVRHPHVAGMLTFAVVVAAAVLLSGCECGVGWPCHGAG